MIITLDHPFIFTSIDIIDLLNDVNTLNKFILKLDKQSKLIPVESNITDDKYKGDGLELLTEALLKLSPIDDRIGIGNYHIINDLDTGVDGVGIGLDGRVATVQVKFRNDPNYFLTANDDHLSNFVVASQNRYKVPIDSNKHMLIVTTAAGINYFTEKEMLLKKVRVINRKNLQQMLNNNILFWDNFRILVNEALNNN